MKLRQTLLKPVQGYWDGGPKQVFDWEIEHFRTGQDSRGEFVRIGCWAANHFFSVALGKTEKLTLSYAKKHLKKSTRVPSTFQYVD